MSGVGCSLKCQDVFWPVIRDGGCCVILITSWCFSVYGMRNGALLSGKRSHYGTTVLWNSNHFDSSPVVLCACARVYMLRKNGHHCRSLVCFVPSQSGALAGDGYDHLDGKPSVVSPHTENELFQGLTVYRAAKVCVDDIFMTLLVRVISPWRFLFWPECSHYCVVFHGPACLPACLAS